MRSFFSSVFEHSRYNFTESSTPRGKSYLGSQPSSSRARSMLLSGLKFSSGVFFASAIRSGARLHFAPLISSTTLASSLQYVHSLSIML
jgi:hypothetical protein